MTGSEGLAAAIDDLLQRQEREEIEAVQRKYRELRERMQGVMSDPECLDVLRMAVVRGLPAASEGPGAEKPAARTKREAGESPEATESPEASAEPASGEEARRADAPRRAITWEVVHDCIDEFLRANDRAWRISDIERGVAELLGQKIPRHVLERILRNDPNMFPMEGRGWYHHACWDQQEDEAER